MNVFGSGLLCGLISRESRHLKRTFFPDLSLICAAVSDLAKKCLNMYEIGKKSGSKKNRIFSAFYTPSNI